MDSRLYAAHQLFKQIGYPFEWLKLSVKKKWSAIRTAWAVHAKKKLSSVWVARAICSKKIVSCLNGSSCLCKKKLFSVGTAQAIHWKKLSAIRTARAICSKNIGNHSKARSSYLFEEKLCWVSIPEQLPHQPLVSNDLLFFRYSWVVPLRTLFTNVSWIVTVLFLPLPHLFRHPFSHSISNGLVTPSSSVCLPCVRIPYIVYKEHFCVRGHMFEVNGIVVK